MADTTLQDLNRQRKPGFSKPPAEEDFLLEINQLLRAKEIKAYQAYPEEFPFLFVFGLPRSGTTILTQLIAHCFDVGYINNLMARFWLAPVTGIRLSKILFKEKKTNFESNYASTHHLTDIHEFGYFWRYWLRKEKGSDFAQARSSEAYIDWDGLKTVLVNIQHEFGKAVVFKNIFGAYHIGRLHHLFQKALFIYIERDPVDTAISILSARKKFYSDIDLWWSTLPIEYDQLKDLPYMEQIGGQVYYLIRYYEEQIRAINSHRVLRVQYQTLCQDPSMVLREIQHNCAHHFGMSLRPDADPPVRFEFRHHRERIRRGNEFRRILMEFAARSGG